MSTVPSLFSMVDSNKLLRVRRRLKNAELSDNEKYPTLLTEKPHLTEIPLKILCTVFACCFCTFTLFNRTNILHNNWKIYYQNINKKCVICWRYNVQVTKQILSNLLHKSIKQWRLFNCIGLDITAFFTIKHGIGWSQKSFKYYVCIFLWFKTKAFHLECLQNLSRKDFLAH